MAKRREPRVELQLPIRVFGTDINGKAFSENLVTVDVSRRGVKLSNIQAQLKAGETIGMTYGQTKGRFVVRWVGAIGTPRAGQIGIEYTSPEKPFWNVPLPGEGVDNFGHQASGKDRRRHVRVKSTNSVELHPEGDSSRIWGEATDLSLGGCFVEMPIPLKHGTILKLALWLKETKLLVKAKVVSSRPGFGIGLQFREMPEEDSERIKQFLQSVSRLPV
jgi:PilZ domain-containing protein